MLPQDGVQIDLGVPIMSLKELTDNKRKTYQQLHLTLYYAFTIGWYSTEIYQILLRCSIRLEEDQATMRGMLSCPHRFAPLLWGVGDAGGESDQDQ